MHGRAAQEFFEDVRALFGSLAIGAGGNGFPGGAGDARGGRVNLRVLLDQLQLMKAEPRNQLRCVCVCLCVLAINTSR